MNRTILNEVVKFRVLQSFNYLLQSIFRTHVINVINKRGSIPVKTFVDLVPVEVLFPI